MSKRKIVVIVSIICVCLLLTAMLVLCLGVIPKYKEKREKEILVRQYRQAKIEKFIEENNKYTDYEVDVAFLGDSLTDGYDLEKFYSQYVVVNRGIAGDTTFDLEERLKVSAYDLKPKVAVMLIGANNFSTMFNNYENIIKGLKYNMPSTEIVLLSLTSMSGEWGKNNEKACFNNVKIELIAQKYGCRYVDLFTPLFDYSSNGIYSAYTTDGGHLTDAGYQVLTDVITPVLANLLP